MIDILCPRAYLSRELHMIEVARAGTHVTEFHCLCGEVWRQAVGLPNPLLLDWPKQRAGRKPGSRYRRNRPSKKGVRM